MRLRIFGFLTIRKRKRDRGGERERERESERARERESERARERESERERERGLLFIIQLLVGVERVRI